MKILKERSGGDYSVTGLSNVLKPQKTNWYKSYQLEPGKVLERPVGFVDHIIKLREKTSRTSAGKTSKNNLKG